MQNTLSPQFNRRKVQCSDANGFKAFKAEGAPPHPPTISISHGVVQNRQAGGWDRVPKCDVTKIISSLLLVNKTKYTKFQS